MHRMNHPQKKFSYRGLFLIIGILSFLLLSGVVNVGEIQAQGASPSFQSSVLQGVTGIGNPTTLQFGPDGRLYLSERHGTIYVYEIERNGPNNYAVVDTEELEFIRGITNHDDVGNPINNGLFPDNARQVTGLAVVGTAANPIIYVSSSDPREGGGSGGADVNLDTNSGTVSRISWTGTEWEHLVLVRGLPRSEENHAVNGLAIDEANQIAYLAVGGFTNMGAPSNNFTFTTEYALAAAVLQIDLAAIGDTTYDMPTLDDPTRPNVNGIVDPADPGYDGVDVADPYGGNDGLNQAKLVPGGPVQIYATGFRNPYDVVLTEDGSLYTIDNGPNYNWGGAPVDETHGQCTNAVNENKTGTYYDNLQNITTPGHYAGHPNPTRANPAGAGLYTKGSHTVNPNNGSDSYLRHEILDVDDPNFATESLPVDWPPIPVEMANPIECEYLIAGEEDGALATWVTSTNGITEYTSENFLGSMQGDLLAVSYDGGVYRMKPTPDGTDLVQLPNGDDDWGYEKLFDGFGIVPLDITAQGDDEIFPGTIWVAVFVDKKVTVFEPVDFPCEGTYDFNLDEDGDGFSNGDEIDNNTNPCSQGSKPADNDGDFISDLNDPDDDNDLILDVVDAFQIDATNGTNTTLPIRYELFQDDPGFGFFGVGFTGLMTNGTTDYLDLYELAELTVGGTAGKATVDHVSTGSAYGAENALTYGFQFGVNVTESTGLFGVEAQLNSPFFNGNGVDGDEQGIYIGTGDQDNYLQFNLAGPDEAEGVPGYEIIQEIDGSPTRTFYPVPDALSAIKITLYLRIDPVAGTYQPLYRSDESEFVELDTPQPLLGSVLDVVQTSQTMAVGIVATTKTSPAFAATWDYIFVETEQPNIMDASPGSVSFGDAVVGTTTDRTVTVTNNGKLGDPDITVNSFDITGSSTFTVTDPATPFVLAPGESADVTVQFLPTVVGPEAATLTIDHTGDNSPGSITLAGNGLLVFDPIYRVNVGGPEISSSGLSWSADSGGSPSVYANHGSSGSTTSGTAAVIDTSDPSLPDNTPMALFQTARWDPNNGDANEMMYEFPVDDGRYEVRIYFAEIFAGTAVEGARVFDVELEGNVPSEMDDLDRFALAGIETGYMVSAEVDVTDGDLTVRFLHQVENPEIQGIEIIPTLVPPSSDLEVSTDPVEFGQVSIGNESTQTLTLTNGGDPSDPAITINGLSYAGADAAAFGDDFAGPVTLQPGDSTIVTLSLTALDGGAQDATLTIDHNGSNGPSMVTLTGTAFAPGYLDVDVDTLDFGNVLLGGTSTQTVTLTNLGNASDPDISVEEIVFTGSSTYQFQYEDYPQPLVIAGGESATIDLTFTPEAIGSYSVTVSVPHDGANSPLMFTAIAQGIEPSTDPIYRFNTGGPTIADPNGGMEWSSNDQYRTAGDPYVTSTNDPIDMSHPSIPANTPMELFQTERTDNGARDNGSEIKYELPIADAGTYEVRLYLAELWYGNAAVGERIYDVRVEGVIPPEFEDIDEFAIAGFEAGFMLSTNVEVTDGLLEIEFLHQEENPSINAIEVLPAGPTVPETELSIDPVSYDFGTVSTASPATQSFTLTHTGEAESADISISDVTFGDAAFSSDFAPVTLSVGETSNFMVTFTAVAGESAATDMTIAHDGDNGNLVIPISGAGSQSGLLVASEAAIDFGNTVIGNTLNASLTLTNQGITGDPDITVSALNVSGSGFGVDTSTPITVSPGTPVTVDLTFAPATGGDQTGTLTIVSDSVAGDIVVDLDGAGKHPSSDPIYRFNTGGPTIADPNGGMEWSSNDEYRTAGDPYVTSTSDPIDMSHPSIPANTPMEIFQTERTDGGARDNGSEIKYELPIADAGTYEVRLYLAELWYGNAAIGERVYDVRVEGVIPPEFEDIDEFANAGLEAGFMLSTQVEVTDGLLEIEFLHQEENPSINAIEILPAGPSIPETALSIDPVSYDFGTVSTASPATQSFTLTHTGEAGSADISISDVTFGDAAFSSDFAPVTLSLGQTTTFTVTFTAVAGEADATDMTIVHDGNNGNLTVPVSGAGAQSGLLTADLSAIDFGNGVIGNTFNASLTLTNQGITGDPDITVSALNVSGGDFSVVTATPISVSVDTPVTVDLTFVPTAAGEQTGTLTIVSDSTDGNIVVDLYGTGTEPSGDPIYRFNAGGPTIVDPNGIMDWSSSDQYRTAGDPYVTTTDNPIDMSHASIPAGTPMEIFQSERTDNGARDNGSEIKYELPIADAGTYEVRLYLAEIWYGNEGIGERIYDVRVEGVIPPVFENIDEYANAGLYAGFMLSTTVEVTDGVLEIEFLHEIDNPSINAIEVLPVGAPISYAGILNSSTTSLDFGDAELGSPATTSLILANMGDPGDPDITVTGLTLGGADGAAFNVTQSTPIVVSVGAPVSLDVNFDPASVGGKVATLTIEHDGTSESIVVDLTGNATAPQAGLSVDPISYEFGTVDPATPVTHTFTLTHTGAAGSADISVSDVTFGNPAFTSDFTPVTLSAGQTSTFDVSFTATMGETSSTGMIIAYAHNGTNDDLTVPLSGTGSEPSVLSAFQTNVAFSQVALGNTSSASIVLSNQGSASDPAINVSALTLGGADAADFSVVQSAPLSVASGSPVTIDLTFNPLAVGSKTATLTIEHDGSNSSLIINLSGTATEPVVTVDPIYRFNAGGATIADPNGGMEWSSSDQYRTAGDPYVTTTDNPIDMSHPSIPAGTPMEIFQSERTDNGARDNGSEIKYELPIAEAGTYEVRLYLAEIWYGNEGIGERIYDVRVEGVIPPVFENIDEYANAGLYAGFMLSTQVEVTDGVLEIEFLHEIDNPSINAIEVLPIGPASPQATLSVSPNSFNFGTVSTAEAATQTFTLSHTGDADSADINVSNVTFGDAAFTSDFAPVTLSMGQTSTFTVSFAATGGVTSSTNMTIVHDGNNNDLNVPLSGIGALSETLTANNTSLSLGAVYVGNSSTANITLTNQGTAGDPDITINSLTLGGADAADFSVTQSAPVTVAVGAPVTLNVTFNPAVAGSKSATLTIGHSGTNGDIVINLTGNANDVAPDSAMATVSIESGGDIMTSSTYNPSFRIENDSTAGQQITSVTFDISTALLPDVVFDPLGQAGDSGGRCLFPISQMASETGYNAPADLCADPFSMPYEGGYFQTTTTFSNFDPGETFMYGVDIDPTSTKGTVPPGPDHAASVSGYELLGSTVTISFSDGSVLTTRLWRRGTSLTGSLNIADSSILDTPSIQVVNVTGPQATVTDANQTVRISGPAGAQVSLLQSEGAMVEQAGGGYDVEPYEANTFLNVTEYTATIGAGGTVDIPVTLTNNALQGGAYGGLNYLVAAVRSGEESSNPSGVWVLEYVGAQAASAPAPEPATISVDPAALSFNMQAGAAAETQNVTISTSDSSTPTLTLSALDDVTSATPTWLTVPASVTAGQAIAVEANSSGLTAGTYTATISASAVDYVGSSFSVTLNVTEAPSLIANPVSLTFNLKEGAPIGQNQNMTSSTSDASTPIVTLNAVDNATSNAPTWLTVPASTTAGQPISLEASSTTLAPGTYTATVNASAAGYTGSSFDVTLTVSDLQVAIVSPAAGATITGSSVMVQWSSNGGDPAVTDHIHVTLDNLGTPAEEAHLGSLPLNGSHTFEGVQPGQYQIIVQMANTNHIVYQNVLTTTNITVEAANVAPVANPDNGTVTIGGSTDVAVVGNDTDSDGTVNPASIVITSQPTQGTLTVNPSGTVTYTHTGTEAGTDSFSYTVSDDDGAPSNAATVTVTIQ